MFKCGKKKKGTRLALAFFLVMLMASSAFALYEAPNKQVETYICTNSTGIYAVTNISTSTGGSGGEGINPLYHRILGYGIIPYNTSKNSEFVAVMYDQLTATTESYIFDEVELGATNDKAPRMLPYPKKLTRGLSVWQGPNTVVVVYYEDMRKI